MGLQNWVVLFKADSPHRTIETPRYGLTSWHTYLEREAARIAALPDRRARIIARSGGETLIVNDIAGAVESGEWREYIPKA